jgi:DNA-binding Xre family transcriptional regulator
MGLTIAEKIRVILNRRDMTVSDLAAQTGQTRQNLTNKLLRDNSTEKEAKEIADKLGCEFECSFRMRDTKEVV